MKTLELKAINWYSENYNLKPQLSPYPTIAFKDSKGKAVEKHITPIVTEYNKAHEEELKLRARERRLKAKEK